MMGNFASLHAYIATVAVAHASSESSKAPSARPLPDDASPVPSLGAIVDKGKLITSAANRQTDGGALTHDRAAILFRRAA